jgi:hypothetical protein
MSLVQRWIYPQLSAIPPPQHEAALRAAKRISFDVIELLGIAFALVITVSITRYALQDARAIERLWVAALNFVVAVPLLAVLVGPFLVRRVRRGLALQAGRPRGP